MIDFIYYIKHLLYTSLETTNKIVFRTPWKSFPNANVFMLLVVSIVMSSWQRTVSELFYYELRR